MALTQRLELKQGQALVMTPQLQQAIKLLQLSNLELAEYVEIELEKNPLLADNEMLRARPKRSTMPPRWTRRSPPRISAPPPISMPDMMISIRMKRAPNGRPGPRPNCR
jgi:DNA-directed RNA polymerase specialized sigma54-like protein